MSFLRWICAAALVVALTREVEAQTNVTTTGMTSGQCVVASGAHTVVGQNQPCTSAPATYRLFTDPPYNGSPSNTAAQNDTAAAQVTTDCNSGGLQGLLIPAGSYQFSTNNPFNLSTPKNPGCNIGGVGPATVLVGSLSGSVGTWFTADGGTGGPVQKCAFHDLTLQWNNTQSAGQPALVFGNASDCADYNLAWVNASEFAQFGTSTEEATRIRSSGWTNNFNNGGNESCNIDIQWATGLRFRDANLNGGVVSDTNTTGAWICIGVNSPSGGIVDTVEFDSWSMQSGTTHGKPYGINISCANVNVNNLSFSDDIFDATSLYGVYVGCPSTGAGYVHVQTWIGNRITPTTGAAVVYDVNNGLSAERIGWANNHLFTFDGSIPFQILAAHDGGTTSYTNDVWTGGDLTDNGTSTTAAVAIGANGWSFSNPRVGRVGGLSTGFQNVYDVTNSAIIDLMIGPTGFAPGISAQNFITEPTYATVGAQRRQIWRPRSARTVSSGTTDTATVADSAIRWNSSTSGSKTETLFACSAALDGISLPIIDEKGDAGSNTIALSSSSGTINGLTSFPLDVNDGAVTLICDGNTDNWTVH